ncbi:DUF711 family protein [Candidatus Peregrinibacteria bacterium]|nr:DUF711 family protein [Candidatus Peregrinibacteria bacterium]
MDKIIRSVCLYQKNGDNSSQAFLDNAVKKLKKSGFTIQTTRFCSPEQDFSKIKKLINCDYYSVGSVTEVPNFDKFLEAKNCSFNLDLSNEEISAQHVKILFDIINKAPHKCFDFAYTFNNSHSSPFFPSASYKKDGFSIGLQPTDLAENCSSLEDWFTNIRNIWEEIVDEFNTDKNFLGIDSSIAPLFEGKSSLINFVKKLGISFSDSLISDIYLKMTNFIKTENPKPTGLCGLMLPCLEDFELAEEYEKGNFSLDKNIYLSLHCGLGIDTYPIGIDEEPAKILNTLKLLQGLSNKYQKSLSARFISDGKAKIGEKTDLKNEYLKDVVVRPLS